MSTSEELLKHIDASEKEIRDRIEMLWTSLKNEGQRNRQMSTEGTIEMLESLMEDYKEIRMKIRSIAYNYEI